MYYVSYTVTTVGPDRLKPGVNLKTEIQTVSGFA